MKIDEARKIIYFDNDAEFENWAVRSGYVIIENEFGHHCFDVPYTNEYIKAIKDDYLFHINSFDSVVKKHGYVTRGIINKPIENLI